MSLLHGMMHVKDRNSEPSHIRLKRILRDLINGGMRPGDRLPSEAQLCAQYGLSRTTIRLALSALANEGLVTKNQGRGTFVSQKRSTASINAIEMPSASHDQELGELTLINCEIVATDTHIANPLQLQLGEPVHRIRQLAQRGDRCISYHISYVPLPFFDGAITELSQLAARCVERKAELLFERAESSIEAVRCDEFRANMFNDQLGAPSLLVETTYYLPQNRPSVFERTFYAGNFVKLAHSWSRRDAR